MADQAVIRKLEGIYQEKVKQIDGNNKVRQQNDNAIDELRQILDE